MPACLGSQFGASKTAFSVLNDPRAPLEGQIIPKPAQRDYKPVAHPDEKINMRHAPENPGRKPGQMEAADPHNGRLPADGGEVAVMAVHKWPWQARALNLGEDEPPHIAPHLLGRGRDPGHRAARGIEDSRRIADGKHI